MTYMEPRASLEFYEQNPEERLRRQFMGDPLWRKG
jgi:hypothetical protein